MSTMASTLQAMQDAVADAGNNVRALKARAPPTHTSRSKPKHPSQPSIRAVLLGGGRPGCPRLRRRRQAKLR